MIGYIVLDIAPNFRVRKLPVSQRLGDYVRN